MNICESSPCSSLLIGHGPCYMSCALRMSECLTQGLLDHQHNTWHGDAICYKSVTSSEGVELIIWRDSL